MVEIDRAFSVTLAISIKNQRDRAIGKEASSGFEALSIVLVQEHFARHKMLSYIG